MSDALWTYLDQRGYVGEVEQGRATIGYLLHEARQVIAAGQRGIPQTAGNEIAR